MKEINRFYSWFDSTRLLVLITLLALFLGPRFAYSTMDDMLRQHGAIVLLIEPESGQIVDANEAASRFYGMSISELKTRRIQDFNGLEPEEVAIERARAKSENRSYFIFPHRAAGGEIKTVEVYSSPVNLPDGRVRLLSIIHDASSKLFAESAFIEYKNKLEKLAESRAQTIENEARERHKLLLLGIFLQGLVIAYLVILIHKRRVAEKALSESKLFRRSILDAMPSEIAVVDSDGVIIAVNEPWKQFSLSNSPHPGEPAHSTLIGVNYFSICQAATEKGSEDASKAKAGIEAVQSGRLSRFRMDYPCHSPTELRWFNMSVTPLDNHGRVVVAHRDITESKLSEKALRESESRFRHLFEDNSSVMLLVDPHNGQVIEANKAAVHYYGYPSEHLTGMLLSEINVSDPKIVAEERVQAVREERNCFYYQHRLATGELREVEVHTTAIKNGQQTQLFSIIHDVSDQREAERALEQHRRNLEGLVATRTEELLKAKEAAEQANMAKSTFIANMSHEIRTPLNAITGMAHLIRRSGVTQEQANRLDKINSAGRHLLGIINAILDLSKIDSGKLILDESEVHLEALIRNVVSMLSDSAEEKHLKLLIESQWTAYPLIGDATRLQQALLNYVINAIKFTDSGNIILRTLIDDEDPESVLVRFEVQDSGIGITPEVSQRLFNPFEQATGLTKRRHGGTGLGLAITRRFAQLMGGEAGVESTPNVGSTFWFTARLKKNGVAGGASTHTSIDAEAVLKQRYSGLRILLVDDEPINREVAMGQLEDVGLLVETAVDGEEAVTMAQKNNFAVILMDMQMPKLNGLEATRLIRQLHGYRKIPIIAMTANAFTEDKTQCLMAGMNDFLSKPFMPEELFAILLRNLEHSTS